MNAAHLSPGLFRLDLIREGHREGVMQHGPGDPTYHSWPCRSGCLAVASSLPHNHTGRSHLCWCRAGCRCHTRNIHQSLPGKGQGFSCDRGREVGFRVSRGECVLSGTTSGGCVHLYSSSRRLFGRIFYKKCIVTQQVQTWHLPERERELTPEI